MTLPGDDSFPKFHGSRENDRVIGRRDPSRLPGGLLFRLLPRGSLEPDAYIDARVESRADSNEYTVFFLQGGKDREAGRGLQAGGTSSRPCQPLPLSYIIYGAAEELETLVAG